VIGTLVIAWQLGDEDLSPHDLFARRGRPANSPAARPPRDKARFLSARRILTEASTSDLAWFRCPFATVACASARRSRMRASLSVSLVARACSSSASSPWSASTPSPAIARAALRVAADRRWMSTAVQYAAMSFAFCSQAIAGPSWPSASSCSRATKLPAASQPRSPIAAAPAVPRLARDGAQPAPNCLRTRTYRSEAQRSGKSGRGERI
jgi:hypothetical protein